MTAAMTAGIWVNGECFRANEPEENTPPPTAYFLRASNANGDSFFLHEHRHTSAWNAEAGRTSSSSPDFDYIPEREAFPRTRYATREEVLTACRRAKEDAWLPSYVPDSVAVVAKENDEDSNQEASE